MLVSRDWAADLAPLGLTPLGEIGSGMEGTVVRLEGDLVAKVWHAAGPDELAVRQRFYADVASALPLRTTRMLDVVRVGDRWASIEPLLHGTPLAGPLDDAGADAVADVLGSLGVGRADARHDQAARAAAGGRARRVRRVRGGPGPVGRAPGGRRARRRGPGPLRRGDHRRAARRSRPHRRLSCTAT